MNGDKGSRRLKRRRSSFGGTLAETGPAIFILLLMLFFPLLDLVAMGAACMSCVTLNDLQLREAALLPKTEAQAEGGAVKKRIVDDWKSKGIGVFVGLEQPVNTSVNYVTGTKDSKERQDMLVRVQTRVRIRPFLTIPFFPGIPGLGAPMDFQITTERLVENFHNAT
jgi:hypothetical protein